MGFLSTKQAAEALGVTSRRVLSLIEAGSLVAEKVGSQWLVDEDSVLSRKSGPRLSGRPKMGQKNLLALRSQTLMHKESPALDFTYDVKAKRAHIDRVHNPELAPLGVGRTPNDVDLARWIEHRYMPPLRPEYLTYTRVAGVSTPEDLMFGSLGLNLSDHYWFCPLGFQISWGEVNFFENDYDHGRCGHRSPDSSTPGALEKWWAREEGQSYLYKASSSSDEREPYNEVLATRLLGRLTSADGFVPYELVERNGRQLSVCPTFVTTGTEFVSANDVVAYAQISEGRDLYRGLVGFALARGVESVRADFAKMVVCDHVMANFDRHRANFGFVHDADGGQNWRVAPLFDNGAGFFSRATMQEMRGERYYWRANPFEEWPSLQLARVEDWAWYDPERLAGFEDDVLEVLSGNRALPEEFAHRAAYHVKRQISEVNAVYQERSSHLVF